MARSSNSILTERVYEICLDVSIMDRSHFSGDKKILGGKVRIAGEVDAKPS